MAKKQKAKTAAVVELDPLDAALAATPHKTLLDKAVEATRVEKKPSREEELRKQGYTILPAGPTKEIRVNRDWIKDTYKDYPYLKKFFLVVDGEEYECDEIIMLAECSMEANDDPETRKGCGGGVYTVHNRSAHVGTAGPVAYK